VEGPGFDSNTKKEKKRQEKKEQESDGCSCVGLFLGVLLYSVTLCDFFDVSSIVFVTVALIV
jgi:hypothetical protein